MTQQSRFLVSTQMSWKLTFTPQNLYMNVYIDFINNFPS